MFVRVGRVSLVAALCALLLAVLYPAALMHAQAGDLPRTMRIATHPSGSLLNAVGSAIASVASQHLPTVVRDLPRTGYISWVYDLNDGDIEMGIITSFEVYLAFNGLDPYPRPAPNMRLLAGGSLLSMGYVVRGDSDIYEYSDLKGKRVGVDMAQATTRIPQEAILTAHGLDLERDVTIVPVSGVVETIQALADGRIDASWAVPGQAALVEAVTRIGPVRWLPMDHEKDGKISQFMSQQVPGATLEYTRPDGVTVDRSVLALSYPIYLIAHKDLPDRAAYEIVRVIWENLDELRNIHGIFNGWTHERMVVDGVIPYHPGALQFYREVVGQ